MSEYYTDEELAVKARLIFERLEQNDPMAVMTIEALHSITGKSREEVKEKLRQLTEYTDKEEKDDGTKV